MAAHFAGQRGAGFSQLGLDHGVSGLRHQWFSASLLDGAGDMAAAFDVEDNGGAGLALQDVLRIQNKLAIRPDDFPGWGDHAQPVGIAIEGQAQLAVVFLYVLDQVRSEEHTSELQSLMRISYAVYSLQKKRV